MLKITTNWHKHSFFNPVPLRRSDIRVDKNVSCSLSFMVCDSVCNINIHKYTNISIVSDYVLTFCYTRKNLNKMFALLVPSRWKTGSIKRWGGGGPLAPRGTLGHWKGHLKNFPGNFCDGGGGWKKIFAVIPNRNSRFWPHLKKNHGNLQTKRYFSLQRLYSLYKMGTFHHKKGHF